MENTLWIIVLLLLLIIMIGINTVIRLLQRSALPPMNPYQGYAMPTPIQTPFREDIDRRRRSDSWLTYFLLFIIIIMFWVFVFKKSGPDPPFYDTSYQPYESSDYEEDLYRLNDY